MPVMIVAGEESGDVLGAGLMKELKILRPDLDFIGVGGTLMEKEGLKSLFPLHDLSVMGFVEIIPHLPRLFKRAALLTDAAQEHKIDALITIDAPDFTLRLAKRLKKKLNVPCIHYVSPSVWAWRAGRAKAMAKFLDHILVLFPFEPPYYERAGLACTFVGHPVAARLAKYAPNGQKIENKLALLPGSRVGEVSRLLEDMLKTFLFLKTSLPDLKAVIPIANNEVRALIEPQVHGLDVELVVDDKKFEALRHCRAALCASGTANLELAMLGLPMVVVYKMAPLTYAIAKLLIHVPYISPVNWVLGEKEIPEFIQDEADSEQMAHALQPLFSDTRHYKAQTVALTKVRERLLCEKKPAQVAAAAVLPYI